MLFAARQTGRIARGDCGWYDSETMDCFENKLIVVRWLEVLWNGRDLSVADQIFAPHYVRRSDAIEVRGPEGVRRMAEMYFKAIPDLEFRLDHMIAELD